MQYTTDELNSILIDHAKWLKGDGGRKASFCKADLCDADLSGANLSGVDLSGADLTGTKLSGVVLPVSDPRGYVALALRQNGEWLIQSGNRHLSIGGARAYWGEFYTGRASIAAQYLMAIDWLEQHGAPEYLEAHPDAAESNAA